MKKYIILSLLFSVLLLLPRCSKEKRIERNLYKDGGRWKMIERETVWYNNSNEIDSITIQQVKETRIYIFKKDGALDVNYQYSDGTTETFTFRYDVVSENKLIIKTPAVELPYIILECTSKRLKLEEELMGETTINAPGYSYYQKKYKFRLLFIKM